MPVWWGFIKQSSHKEKDYMITISKEYGKASMDVQ